ncbi:hypothetical protein RFI_36842 [Reticulomyxa filosa]|uniref:Uncharacterized protein n=1 Tax=Reticulomyxa filosa TaxID=46433 RepID=X6LF24_RETFI|nr:hypothetical protein RFI_36842 [Reticulomyxa filosa]|eukprot:ETO00598.1 hypothetical protein RFI_36842 [Reticulomyxa filosa]
MMIFFCGCNTSFSKRKNKYIEYGVCYLFLNFFFDIIHFICFFINSRNPSVQKKIILYTSSSTLSVKKNFGVEAIPHPKKNQMVCIFYFYFFACFHQQKIICPPHRYKEKKKIIGIGAFGSSTKMCLIVFICSVIKKRLENDKIFFKKINNNNKLKRNEKKNVEKYWNEKKLKKEKKIVKK